MRIENWLKKKIAEDPEYSRAAQLVELEQTIADLIVSLRVKKGLTQATLGRLAGVTQATISLLENGEANPRASTISKVFEALLSYVPSAPAPAVEPSLLTGPAHTMASTHSIASSSWGATFVVASKTKWHDLDTRSYQPAAA
jgi:transcriptional regulator with XRE-family HTH domain